MTGVGPRPRTPHVVLRESLEVLSEVKRENLQKNDLHRCELCVLASVGLNKSRGSLVQWIGPTTNVDLCIMVLSFPASLPFHLWHSSELRLLAPFSVSLRAHRVSVGRCESGPPKALARGRRLETRQRPQSVEGCGSSQPSPSCDLN